MTEIERKYDDSKQVISTYTYDSLNRVTQKVTDYIGFLLGDYITDYTYCDITSTQKTTRIASETCRFDKKELGKFEYTYYPNGNVATVKKDGVLIREYIYDKYDRLTWEKNYTTNFEYSYVYDSNGNLTKKSRATKSSNNSTTSEINLTYGYNGDKMVSITTTFSDIPGVSSSQNFTYDALGNLTTYKGNTLEWQGRKLTKVGDTTMQYDYKGLRTRKGERYYYWLGNTLKMERWGENTIYYYYDESGVSGFRYNNTDYYYHKNIFGDVIAIYNVNGNLQCTYEYDAWGNHTVTNATDDNIGDVNPIRYRGYYYDVETQLFYCNSRYYSPELCRWISPDSIEYLDPSSINGLNLYCYCMNNPIMYADPSGNFPVLACILAVTALVGLGLTIGGVASDNNTLTAIGLGITGVAALGAGGLAIAGALATGAIATGVVGGVTAVAGLGSLGFMSAEIQEATGNGNWIMDSTGMSEGLYNGLLLGTASIATLGSVASFGMLATNPMTGFTHHGLEQALLRDGHGVSRKAILNAVKHPLDVVNQGAKGVKYVGKLATVVLNSTGKVITTWATTSAGWRNIIILCFILGLLNDNKNY